MADTGRQTGLFKAEDGEGVIVLWRGQQIARYDAMADFVAAHVGGLEAMERRQEALLEQEYRDNI